MDDFGDFDEDILNDQNIDNFDNVQDDGEDALNKLLEKDKPKPKKKRLNLAPRLTEKELTGPKGYCALRKMFDGWKPTHKNPLDDISSMIQKFEYWGHSLAPNMNFKDFMEKSMKLSKTRAIKTYMMKLRSGMPLFEESDDKRKERSVSPDGVVEDNSKEPNDDFDDDFDDSAFGGPATKNVDFEAEWADAMQDNMNSEKTMPAASTTILELSDEEEERILNKFRTRASPELSDLEDEQPTQRVPQIHGSDEDAPTQHKNEKRKRRLLIESDDEDESVTQITDSVQTPMKLVENIRNVSQDSNSGFSQQISKRRPLIIESDDENEQFDSNLIVESMAETVEEFVSSQKENSSVHLNKKKRRLIIESDDDEDEIEKAKKENSLSEEAAMDLILSDF